MQYCILYLLPAVFCPQSTDAVRSSHPSNCTLAHDAVAAVVSHKHHSITCDGAGLIHFVYGSHSHWAADLILHKILFLPFFSRAQRSRIGGLRWRDGPIDIITCAVLYFVPSPCCRLHRRFLVPRCLVVLGPRNGCGHRGLFEPSRLWGCLSTRARKCIRDAGGVLVVWF